MRLYFVTVTHPREARARKRWQQRFYVLAGHPFEARQEIEQSEYNHYPSDRRGGLEWAAAEAGSAVVQLGSAMVG